MHFGAGLDHFGAVLVNFGAGWDNFGAGLLNFGEGLNPFGAGLVNFGARLDKIWSKEQNEPTMKPARCITKEPDIPDWSRIDGSQYGV